MFLRSSGLIPSPLPIGSGFSFAAPTVPIAAKSIPAGLLFILFLKARKAYPIWSFSATLWKIPPAAPPNKVPAAKVSASGSFPVSIKDSLVTCVAPKPAPLAVALPILPLRVLAWFAPGTRLKPDAVNSSPRLNSVPVSYTHLTLPTNREV